MHLTSRPSLAALAVAMTIAAGVAVLQLQGGSASRAATPVVTATRGDVVVSVGGDIRRQTFLDEPPADQACHA